MAQSITLDISTLTLGEAAAAEYASGQNIQELIRSRASLIMLAMFVHDLRNSEQPRSWHELSNLSLLDASSLISQLLPDGPSVKSSG